jgi:DnaJ homolog subfamily C member 14
MPTPPNNLEESMTEEEFMEWLRNAVQAGMFDDFGGSTSATTETPSPKAGTGAKGSGTSNSGGSNKRKKKGKKQW